MTVTPKTGNLMWGTMFWWDAQPQRLDWYRGYGSPAQCAELATRVTARCMQSHWTAGDDRLPIPGGHSLRAAARAAGVGEAELARLDRALIVSTERRWARERAERAGGVPILTDRLAAYRDRYRYGISYPHTRKVWGWCKSAARAAAKIERDFAPGYTTQPYVQLIAQSPLDRFRNRGGRVIAEYERGSWLDPLVAAGFVPRRVL